MEGATDRKSVAWVFGLAEHSPKPVDPLMVKVGHVLGSCSRKCTNVAELARFDTAVAEFGRSCRRKSVDLYDRKYRSILE
jgi:hypothetical protein